MALSKYNHTQILEIPNFNDIFEATSLGFSAPEYSAIFELSSDMKKGQRIIQTAIEFTGIGNFEIGMRYSIKFVHPDRPNELGKHRKTIAKEDGIIFGDSETMEKLLNDGYVKNGRLRIRIESHCESRIFVGKKSMFIWNIPSFNSMDSAPLYAFRDRQKFYCHRQIQKLHSNILENQAVLENVVPDYADIETVPFCFQKMHGVRIFAFWLIPRSLGFAKAYQMTNVMKFLENSLIENEIGRLWIEKAWKERSQSDISYFVCNEEELEKWKDYPLYHIAIHYKLEKFLKFLIRKETTKAQLTKVLEKLDLHEMSSESMKTFVNFFFEL